jgi:hypothetical protein
MSTVIDDIRLVSADELARMWGYEGATTSFNDFCKRMRITTIPGRRGWYDPHLVRRRMNEVQGLFPPPNAPDKPMSLVEQRRARNATV